jgi:hypothetical protein
VENIEIDPGKMGCIKWILCGTVCYKFYFGINHGQKSKDILWPISNSGKFVGPGQAGIVGPGILQLYYIDTYMGQIYTEGSYRLRILLTDENNQRDAGFY